MEEQWKNFGSVKVSNTGIVLSKKYGRVVGWLTKDGYKKVGVSEQGKRVTWSVHRLVYYLFGESYNTNLEINHIDGNKLNNNISNLELVTHSENIQHAWDTGLMKHSKEGLDNIITSNIIAVICVETGEVFASITEAARAYNISKTGISANLRGKQLTAGKHKITKEGLTWKKLIQD